MQLQLEIDELNLLANLLLHRIDKTPADPVLWGESECDVVLRVRVHAWNDLLDRILSRDLRLNPEDITEIEDLLNVRRRKLIKQIVWSDNDGLRPELQRKLALLDRILQKVEELAAYRAEDMLAASRYSMVQ